MISNSKLCSQPFSSSFVELTWICYLISKWILFLPIYWSYRSPEFCWLLSVYRLTNSEHGVQSLLSTFLFGVCVSQIEMNLTILIWLHSTTRADECSGFSFVIQACFHLFIWNKCAFSILVWIALSGLLHAYRSQFFSTLAKATTILIDRQARLISYSMLLEVSYVVGIMRKSTCVTKSSLKVVEFIMSCYGEST